MKGLLIFVLCLNFVAGLAQTSPVAKQMALVNGGTYIPLYSSDSQKVTVKKFYMDIYPVTNTNYLSFTEKYPEWKKTRLKRIFADSNYLKRWSSDNIFPKELANSPVVNVSWFAAKKYCECQGKRLPSTAEWELAARANEKKPDARKDSSFNQWVLNWVSKPSTKVLQPVGSTFKNYFGIYDLHGLVWEWTYDFNSALTTGESRGNSSLDNTFFCGGGSFASKDINNYASFMRFAMRASVKANYCVPNLGFRCAKDLTK